jgi:cyclopropane fatty-acyl-phospholipid synthase-like methyltransferase
MSDSYWTSYWTDHGLNSTGHHPQARVHRTLNKEPISEAKWQETIGHIQSNLSLEPQHRLLDLCGGNGLIARALADQCDSVTIVDLSECLLREFDAEPIANVVTRQADLRQVQFPPSSYDRILLYAALQYLSPSEAVTVFQRMCDWLKKDGVLFLGDIPDARLQWKFYDTPERQSDYFAKLQAGQPIVGTWFDRDWLSRLAAHCGFKSFEIVPQPQDQIYSWFRFDMVCRK